MRRFTILALSVLVIADPAFAKDAHPYAESLQKKATEWLRKNNAFGPTHRMVSELGEAVGDSLKKGRNFSLTLGPNLARSGKGTVLASWGDQLFVFTLTNEQLNRKGVKPGGVNVEEGSVVREKAGDSKPIQLSELKFEGGQKIDGNKELKGTVTCTAKGKVPDKVAVRLAYSANGTVARFLYPDSVPEKGKLALSFKAFNEGSDKKVAGPIIAFVDLCIVRQESGNVEITVLSNPIAILLDVQ